MPAKPQPDRLTWPTQLPQFSHISRSWDRTHNRVSARVLPGEYYVTRHDEVLVTVLGSCVSACIRDPRTGIGGMNHFMLPAGSQGSNSSWGGNDALITRYGVSAMEMLINDLLKLGLSKSELEIKVFGGGKILDMEVMNVGDRNIAFIREFLKVEGLRAAAADLGGPHPRKVVFFPDSGRVKVQRLRRIHTHVLATQEKAYGQRLVADTQTSGGGDIDLFD